MGTIKILEHPNHTEATIRRWLTCAGMHGERMRQHSFQRLELKHIQLDEIKTRLREKTQELWVWAAIGIPSKVIPVLEVGPTHAGDGQSGDPPLEGNIGHRVSVAVYQ